MVEYYIIDFYTFVFGWDKPFPRDIGKLKIS